MTTARDFIQQLEQRGEQSVREGFLHGDYKHPETYNLTKDWLSSKDSERAVAREEESLSNSRKALRIAHRANIIAIIATIIALIAVAVAIAIALFQRK